MRQSQTDSEAINLLLDSQLHMMQLKQALNKLNVYTEHAMEEGTTDKIGPNVSCYFHTH